MAKIERKQSGWVTFGKDVYKAVMTGVSYIIPLVVSGGMVLSLSLLIWGNEGARIEGSVGATWRVFGGSILGLLIPILAAYVAYSLAEKPGLIPGLAGGLAAASLGAGFFGGLIAGIVAGYTVRYLKKISYPPSFSGIVTIFFYPLIGTIVVGFVMLFVIGEPVGALNEAMISWLGDLQTTNFVTLGIVLGAMAGFDMGGPVNKAGYAFALAAIEAGNGLPYAAFAAAKSLPGIIVSLATWIVPQGFTDGEKDAAKSSWLLGVFGISEGAIPFALRDPLRVIPATMAGGAFAAVISLWGKSSLQSAGGSMLTIPVTTNAGYWVAGLLGGAVVGTIVLAALKKQKVHQHGPDESSVEESLGIHA